VRTFVTPTRSSRAAAGKFPVRPDCRRHFALHNGGVFDRRRSAKDYSAELCKSQEALAKLR
jgi:hypothetical protein